MVISINNTDYFKVEISWWNMHTHQIIFNFRICFFPLSKMSSSNLLQSRYTSSNLAASFDSFPSTKFPLEMVETKMKKGGKGEKKGRVYRFAGYRFRCGETTPGNDERPCVPLEDKSFVFPRYSSPVIYFDSVLLLLFIIWTSVHLTHHRSTKGGNTRDAHSQPEESFHRLRSWTKGWNRIRLSLPLYIYIYTYRIVFWKLIFFFYSNINNVHISLLLIQNYIFKNTK